MLRREVKRVRKGTSTFEWKRRRIERKEGRESEKRNADRRGDGGQKNGGSGGEETTRIENGVCEWIVALLNARKRP